MEKLVRDAKELFNVHMSGGQVMSLITYEKELLEWNKKFNLTAIRDVESIRTKHFWIHFPACWRGHQIPRFASLTWELALVSRAFPSKFYIPT